MSPQVVVQCFFSLHVQFNKPTVTLTFYNLYANITYMETPIHNGETENKNDLQTSFSSARRSVETAASDLEFRELCRSNGIDPSDRHNPAYWAMVAEREWSISQDENLSGFDAYTHVVAGSTPDAIMHSLALEHRLSWQEAHDHKAALSRYNSLIRGFAADYPDLSAVALKTELQRTAAVTVASESKRIQSEADYLIRSIVHGAQHELGFKAILEASGLPFRETTDEEDLKGGDYIVTLPDGSDIKLDVKASLSEVDKKNHGSNGQPYAINREGDVVIYSCLSESELGDSFSIDKAIAESRVPIVMGALFQASQRKSA